MPFTVPQPMLARLADKLPLGPSGRTRSSGMATGASPEKRVTRHLAFAPARHTGPITRAWLRWPLSKRNTSVALD